MYVQLKTQNQFIDFDSYAKQKRRNNSIGNNPNKINQHQCQNGAIFMKDAPQSK